MACVKSEQQNDPFQNFKNKETEQMTYGKTK